VDYEFVTSGEATHGSEAEASDEVTENDDGTWAIRGVVSNGHADSFEFQGEILDANLTGPATVTVDGEERDFGGDASAERHTLAVETEPGADLVRYTIVTSGEATHGSKAEPTSDSITQNSDGTWTIDGVTGDGYADSFEFEGEILDVSLSNPATVLVDGSEHTSA
jgi:hypothetical protein